MKKLILPTLIISILTAPVAMAKHGHHDSHHYNLNSHHKNNSSNWAKVTRVKPITEMIEIRTPREQCWHEPVRSVKRKHHYDPASTIIGSVIGGVIGHKVSHNKKVGSVVGAVVGGTVGYKLGHQNKHDYRGDRHVVSERHCVQDDRITYKERVVGYHVWYRFNGSKYKTRMDQHPGKRIKVAVNVRPYSS